MNIDKIFGYFLLFVGLGIISFSLYYSYNVYTAKSSAPEVFKLQKSESVLSQTGKDTDLQGQMEKIIQEQFKEMLPPDFLPKILNLICWSIGAGVLIFGGSNISNIGIKLIKKND